MNESPFVSIRITTEAQSKLNRIREQLDGCSQSSSFDETITELIEVANSRDTDINIPLEGYTDERD